MGGVTKAVEDVVNDVGNGITQITQPIEKEITKIFSPSSSGIASVDQGEQFARDTVTTIAPLNGAISPEQAAARAELEARQRGAKAQPTAPPAVGADSPYYQSPEYKAYLERNSGPLGPVGTADTYDSPYFGTVGSGSLGKQNDRAYEAYLARIAQESRVTPPVEVIAPPYVPYTPPYVPYTPPEASVPIGGTAPPYTPPVADTSSPTSGTTMRFLNNPFNTNTASNPSAFQPMRNTAAPVAQPYNNANAFNQVFNPTPTALPMYSPAGTQLNPNSGLITPVPPAPQNNQDFNTSYNNLLSGYYSNKPM
jgi:hypothetical protein